MGSQFAWFALIFGGIVVAILVLATVVKLREVRRAATWTRTRGRILVACVESRQVTRGEDSAPRTGNFARVEYEYQVGKKRLRGKRVSIGEEAADFRVAETLARYPVGTEVEVFYDPQEPTQAVLERELPADFSRGFGIALLYFGGGSIAVFLYFSRGVDWLSSLLPAGSNAAVAVTLGGLGVFTAAIAWALQRQAALAQDWLAIDGEIVAATTASYTATAAGSDSLRRWHVPRVIYRYRFDGHEYHGDRRDLGAIVSFGSQHQARKRLGRFAPGMAVRVRVNPDNPAESTLAARAGHVWILWGLAAGLLVLAWLAGQPPAAAPLPR